MVSEVWQEQTLLRLMQIIDLPFLESLLEAKESSLQPSSSLDDCDEALHNSSILDWEILKAFRNTLYVGYHFELKALLTLIYQV